MEGISGTQSNTATMEAMTERQIVDETGVVQSRCETGDVLRLLADSRRRRIVAALNQGEDDWVDVETLRRRVADDVESPVDWETELHHVTLPMLDDMGLVEYDRRSGAVRCYRCELVQRVLEATE